MVTRIKLMHFTNETALLITKIPSRIESPFHHLQHVPFLLPEKYGRKRSSNVVSYKTHLVRLLMRISFLGQQSHKIKATSEQDGTLT